jgi:hypothetical protein
LDLFERAAALEQRLDVDRLPRQRRHELQECRVVLSASVTRVRAQVLSDPGAGCLLDAVDVGSLRDDAGSSIGEVARP